MALIQWIYNSKTGAVIQLPSPAAYLQLKSGLGWHGPFNSKTEAINYYNANKAKNPGWSAPTSDIGETISNVPGAVDETIQQGLGLSDANIQSWLIRIGEILLGIVLVGVGVAKLTGTTNAVAKLVKAKI